MKKTQLALALLSTSIVASTPVLATNGDNLIGLGAQSRALGGTGTAAFFGSENALKNPALLAKSQGTEFTFGGTLFQPSVKATTDVSSPATDASATSSADTNIIPEVSLSTRINENMTFGIGMFGSAGMGVNYRDTDSAENAALFQAQSNLQLMKFSPSLSYNRDNFGIGFAPVLQYGQLDLNYVNGSGSVGAGASQDLGMGYNLGAYFDVNQALTLAVSYHSAISMKYDDQISVAAAGFGLDFSDKLDQPAEIKIGVAYTTGNWLLTADATQIKWGDAAGYKDFGWEDQNVYALGARYSQTDYWIGAGYNIGSDPIEKQGIGSTGADPSTGGMTGYTAQAIDLFNNHFFPGIVESHITFGGGYKLSQNLTLEGAIVYAPEVTKTVNTGVISSAVGSGFLSTADAGSTHTVDHSQVGYTIAMRYNF